MKKAIKYVGLGLLGVVALLLIWGVGVEPYLIDTEEEVAGIPDLPAAWEGQKVGVIADLQVGMWLNNNFTIRRSAERLVEQKPAVVLIAGDFVYGASDDTAGDIGKVRELVRPLTAARIPTYAVLGNHDYKMTKPYSPAKERAAERVRSALEAEGVRMLKNEAVPLRAPANRNGPPETPKNDRLYLVGVWARWPNEDEPATAVAQVPDGAPRLAMMHNPMSFPAFPAGTAPLAVAGHTHGGQVRVPFTPEWSWISLVKRREMPVDGWIEEGFGKPGNRLYVNRGIGFSVVPVRINCPPEITLFTLRPG